MAERSVQVVFFGEDGGHEDVIVPLIRRVASALGVPVAVRTISSSGGLGSVLTEFEKYVAQLTDLGVARPLPEVIVAAVDANCHGFAARRTELLASAGLCRDLVVAAIPNPHVERWLLADPAAFKAALGVGCKAPKAKCQRDRYKRLLMDAVRDSGQRPVQGGLEHAAAIVAAMDLDRPRDPSLAAFVKDLRAALKRHA